MSKPANPSDEMYHQTICENDTILMVYADVVDAYEDAREFIDDLLGDEVLVDLYEEHTETTERVELKIEFDEVLRDNYEKSISKSFTPFVSSEKRALRQRFEEKELPEEFTLEVTETTETCFEHSVRDPIKDVVEELIEPEAFENYGFSEKNYPIAIADFTREIDDKSIDSGSDATIEQICRVSGPSSSDIKPRDVLRHKEDRSQHKTFWDDEPQRWSFPVTIHLEAESEEEINNLAQGVIPRLRMDLTRLDGVDSVRLKKCDKKIDTEGSCHQL